jgi:S1-C subfamily serine protease
MKLSGFAARALVLLSAPCCVVWLSCSQGLLSRIFHSNSDAKDEHVLAPGELRQGALDLATAREFDYTLDVPPSCVLARVKLNCTQTELELSARAADTDDDDDPDFRVTTDAGTATLSISRFTEPAIAEGKYRLRVAYRSQGVPRSVDRRIERIAYSIRAELFETRVDGELRAGEMLGGALTPETGGFRTFKVDVPAEARALRIDIADAQSDLDLFVERGHPVRTLSEPVYFAQHNYGRETLVIDASSSPPLEPGAWFVDVLDIQDDQHATPFKLLATFDRAAPAELLAIPVIAVPSEKNDHGANSSDAKSAATDAKSPASPRDGMLARALVGVVEVLTDDGAGSGTLLTGDGWILTNAHVVTGLGGEMWKEVVISMPLDPRRPSVEMFRGRVDRVDAQRDLALVQVSSGFYGQPLPAGYVFPTVEMGDPDTLAIGDPLWLVGYPSTGGEGSRVTITATRGVVAGFDTVAFGTVLKTDATITLGNSGGAALDARGRIVGVPTSTIELGSGHIGYVHPLSALPAEWRAILAAALPRTK